MSDLEDIIDDIEETPAEEEPEQVEQEAETATDDEPVEEQAEAYPEPAKAEPSESEKGILSALQQQREETRQLKALLEQREAAKAEPMPDVLDDPAGFAATIEKRFEQRYQNDRLNMSEAMARQTHGDEKVTAAQEALKASGDEAVRQQVLSSPMPYEALVKWHTQQQFIQQVGNDPDAFMAKERERIRAEIKAEYEANQTAAAIKSAPPSLAGATNIGGRNPPAAPEHTPLDDILG